MQIPCKGAPAFYGQKRQCMAGKDSAAYHQTGHCTKYQEYKPCLHHAHRMISPFQNVPDPTAVQDMVYDKKGRHPNADPFMGRLPNQLVCHKQKQRRRHSNINCQFQNHLRLHSDSLTFPTDKYNTLLITESHRIMSSLSAVLPYRISPQSISPYRSGSVHPSFPEIFQVWSAAFQIPSLSTV